MNSGSGEFLAVLVYDGDSDYVTLPVDGVLFLDLVIGPQDPIHFNVVDIVHFPIWKTFSPRNYSEYSYYLKSVTR